MNEEVQAQKTGKFRRSWQLTKSAWQVLKLDKELATLPLLGSVFSIVALIIMGSLGLLALGGSKLFTSGSSDFNPPGWEVATVMLLVYFVLTLVANFFSAALIFGATERFRGGDPTVRSSVAGAKRRFGPLALFSLMMATVGLALQTLEERLPFAGQIAAWLFNAAWSIANVFALPIIVLSEESVQPLDATRRSVSVIKKVWGESVVVNVGISLISLLAFAFYIVIGFAVAVAAGAIGNGLNITGAAAAIGITVLVVLAIIAFVALLLVFSALGGIAKAALYYYATTGAAPANFDTQLLQSAIKPKKSRKLFGA